MPAPPSRDERAELAVSIRRLEAGYGETTALSLPFLTVEKGQRWAILGAGGVGKSTLINAICGSRRPDFWYRGVVDTCEWRVQRQTVQPDELASGATIPTASDPLSAADEIRRLAGHLMDQKAARRLLDAAEVAECSAPLKIFDEPDLNQPAESLDVLQSMLDQISRSSAVLLVTHNLALARKTCTHVLLLDVGVPVEQGLCKQFFESPQTERGRRFAATGG